MDSFNQAKEALSALLTENTNIGIVVTEHQSIDVLAAALSLHLIFQDSGRNSQIISRKDPTVEHSFLVGIDQLRKQFGGVTKSLTVSFPYRDGDIEKVSYNIEGDRLNVNLFAEEQGISFEEKDIKYIREGSAPQLIFTIGVSNPDELVGLVDKNSKIVNIDNTIANTLFGDVVLVDASFSSLSEVIAKFTVTNALQVEFDVAQNLLDGIAFATQNFMSPKTSPVAFEMIGVLMQKGAIRKSMKEAQRSSDTSLSMLNKPQKSFNPNSQNKPFANQKPFVKNQPLDQHSQGRSFQGSQDKQFVQQENQSVRLGFQEDQQVRQPQALSQNQYDASSSEDQSSVVPTSEKVSQQNVTDINPNNIPTEDEAPSDWFVPKVFKSAKNQD